MSNNSSRIVISICVIVDYQLPSPRLGFEGSALAKQSALANKAVECVEGN